MAPADDVALHLPFTHKLGGGAGCVPAAQASDTPARDATAAPRIRSRIKRLIISTYSQASTGGNAALSDNVLPRRLIPLHGVTPVTQAANMSSLRFRHRWILTSEDLRATCRSGPTWYYLATAIAYHPEWQLIHYAGR